MTEPVEEREPEGFLSIAGAEAGWRTALCVFAACLVAAFLTPLPVRYLAVAGAGAALATLTLLGLLLDPYRRRK